MLQVSDILPDPLCPVPLMSPKDGSWAPVCRRHPRPAGITAPLILTGHPRGHPPGHLLGRTREYMVTITLSPPNGSTGAVRGVKQQRFSP